MEPLTVENEFDLPWAMTQINIYPENIQISFKIESTTVDAETLQTLIPGSWINDCVISSFISICNHINDMREPLIFDLFFITHLLRDHYVRGFFNFTKKKEAWTHDIWLVPKNEDGHRSLIVTVFSIKTIIYIDSLHWKLKKKILKRLCSFIEEVFNNANVGQFDWSQWTYYQPHDIPLQVGDSAGNNCGVHLCVWMYIISTGKSFRFEESIMDKARK